MMKRKKKEIACNLSKNVRIRKIQRKKEENQKESWNGKRNIKHK